MFAGFTSRWTSPSLCRVSSAVAISAVILTRGAGGEGTVSFEHVRERLPEYEARGEVRVSICLAGVHDGDEVPVGELAGNFAFPREAAAICLVFRELCSKDLQRDHFATRLAGGFEDDPHGPLAEDVLEAIRA